ncbi:AAA family ATPase [bacterium]|nr:AAA family ATPase [bacterium]
MIEKKFLLEQVHPVELFGTNNENWNLLKRAFPQVKFIARGNEISLRGDEEEVDHVEEKLLLIIKLSKHGALSAEKVADLLAHPSDGHKEAAVHKGGAIVRSDGGVQVKAKTLHQHELVEKVADNDLVFAIGPAGTGKTYTSVALAVRALKHKQVKKIILTRPAVEAGENLGFLPGDLKDKIDPYLRPLYDALDDMLSADKLKMFIENRVIEIAPLAFMRGRTLNNAFVILDEAQNCTEAQLKMFLTRMGPEAKIIVTGDLTQIDLPAKTRSGLPTALRILKDIEGISQVYFDTRDVIRHQLVKRIITAYDNDNKHLHD